MHVPTLVMLMRQMQANRGSHATRQHAVCGCLAMHVNRSNVPLASEEHIDSNNGPQPCCDVHECS